MMDISASRRQLLAGLSIATAAGFFGGGTSFAKALAGGPLLLLDPALSVEQRMAALRIMAGAEHRLLTGDLVRAWRDGLGALVEARSGTAITRWDKAITLRGLAREAGIPIRQDRSGRSLFLTSLG